MGHTTDFIGHIDIAPALNRDEIGRATGSVVPLGPVLGRLLPGLQRSREEFYDPVAWLRYLIDHFLRPGAHASTSNGPLFQHFTFDHVLDGTVVGCRRDNKELFAITVARNQVREEIIRPADSRYVDYPPLPYEEVIDRDLGPSGNAVEQRGSAGLAVPRRLTVTRSRRPVFVHRPRCPGVCPRVSNWGSNRGLTLPTVGA